MMRKLTAAPRILLLGGNGQVGFELRRSLATLGTVVATSRAQCDIARAGHLANTLREVDPDLIVNAAAYTAVDAAERDAATARAVNAEAPGVLAEFAASASIPLVHFSTDYVFDGKKGAPYVEDDAARPLSVYGATKAAGDAAVVAAGGAHLILRAGWIYGLHGTNFVRTILRAAGERDRLQVVTDQIGTPTPASLLADVTAHLLREYLRCGGDAFPFGTYHVAPAGATDWYRYAQEVLALAARQGIALRAHTDAVEATTSAAYQASRAAGETTVARRPLDARLDTSRLAGTFGLHMPDWRDGLGRLFEQLPRSW